MNKNSSNIIKEVLLAFAMGIIFLVVLIALSYIIFPNQMTEGENTEELLLNRFSNANCIYNLLCKKDIKQN